MSARCAARRRARLGSACCLSPSATSRSQREGRSEAREGGRVLISTAARNRPRPRRSARDIACCATMPPCEMPTRAVWGGAQPTASSTRSTSSPWSAMPHTPRPHEERPAPRESTASTHASPRTPFRKGSASQSSSEQPHPCSASTLMGAERSPWRRQRRRRSHGPPCNNIQAHCRSPPGASTQNSSEANSGSEPRARVSAFAPSAAAGSAVRMSRQGVALGRDQR
mmetsp:Transcript_25250/g.82821  ORF Transcript_25250/g.82821 Transcript_25250/m.82821 type:complete len:226 (-) Transcript_25250:69-746(-)